MKRKKKAGDEGTLAEYAAFRELEECEAYAENNNGFLQAVRALRTFSKYRCRCTPGKRCGPCNAREAVRLLAKELLP
jgi:hypothetical protein